MYDLNSFTGQDVMKWIGCDKKSGDEIFAKAGFYNAILNIVSANFARKYSKSFAEVFSAAQEEIGKICERLKNKEKKYEFENSKKFFIFFYGSLWGLIYNQIFTPQPKKGNSEKMDVCNCITKPASRTDQKNIDSTDNVIVDTEISTQEKWLLKYQINKINESAIELIEAFRKWLDNRPRVGDGIKQHFSTLFFVTFRAAYTNEHYEDNHIYILAFLQNNEFNDIIKDYFSKQPGYKENTYKSNNTRLRKNHWKQFLGSEEGQELYQRLQEESPDV